MVNRGEGLPIPPSPDFQAADDNSDSVAARDIRIGRLDTVAAVRRELARLYRAARRASGPHLERGEAAVTAARLAYLLHLQAKLIEGSDLERRVGELEHMNEKGMEK